MFAKRAIVFLSSTLIFTFSAILWSVAPPAWAATVYTNNFEGVVGPEWSNATTSSTPVGGRRFLGQFGNEHATLSLSNLPQHTKIKVTLDFLVINS